MDYETIMAINASASLNAEINPLGFKAIIFDTSAEEVWFFIDKIGAPKTNVSCQAVWNRKDDKFYFGTMVGDWEELGSNPDEACAHFANMQPSQN